MASHHRWPLLRKLLVLWCPEGDLNPHDRLRSADFKSAVSADFTIRACEKKITRLHHLNAFLRHSPQRNIAEHSCVSSRTKLAFYSGVDLQLCLSTKF
jgi:hypothetical protein